MRKLETFLQAIEIISKNHSTKIIINKPKDNFVGGLGSSEFKIGIIDCCASVINNLTREGFSLSMTDGITEVTKLTEITTTTRSQIDSANTDADFEREQRSQLGMR